MTQQEPFDGDRAAVVIMDFQNGIVGGFASDPQGTAERAASVLAAARAAGIPVVHVVHRGGRFADDSPDVEIHPGVAPAGGSASSPRTRAGSFSTTGLEVLLREMGRDTLALMGVATRALSDVRQRTVPTKRLRASVPAATVCRAERYRGRGRGLDVRRGGVRERDSLVLERPREERR